MSDSIHGHKVMEMMATADKAYSKSELIDAVNEVFGEQARFHTCMDSDLTIEQLIDFLASKGKFVESEQGLRLPAENICQE